MSTAGPLKDKGERLQRFELGFALLLFFLFFKATEAHTCCPEYIQHSLPHDVWAVLPNSYRVLSWVGFLAPLTLLPVGSNPLILVLWRHLWPAHVGSGRVSLTLDHWCFLHTFHPELHVLISALLLLLTIVLSLLFLWGRQLQVVKLVKTVGSPVKADGSLSFQTSATHSSHILVKELAILCGEGGTACIQRVWTI